MSNLKNRLAAKAGAAVAVEPSTDVTVTTVTQIAPENAGTEAPVTRTEGTAVAGSAPGYEGATAPRESMVGDIKVVSL